MEEVWFQMPTGLAELRQTLTACVPKWNLVERMCAHIAGARRKPLLNDGELRG